MSTSSSSIVATAPFNAASRALRPVLWLVGVGSPDHAEGIYLQILHATEIPESLDMDSLDVVFNPATTQLQPREARGRAFASA